MTKVEEWHVITPGDDMPEYVIEALLSGRTNGSYRRIYYDQDAFLKEGGELWNTREVAKWLMNHGYMSSEETVLVRVSW